MLESRASMQSCSVSCTKMSGRSAEGAAAETERQLREAEVLAAAVARGVSAAGRASRQTKSIGCGGAPHPRRGAEGRGEWGRQREGPALCGRGGTPAAARAAPGPAKDGQSDCPPPDRVPGGAVQLVAFSRQAPRGAYQASPPPPPPPRGAPPPP